MRRWLAFGLRLPLARPVLWRIVLWATAAALVPTAAMLTDRRAPAVLAAFVAMTVAGGRYAFTIALRSAQGFAWPAQYPASSTGMVRALGFVALYVGGFALIWLAQRSGAGLLLSLPIGLAFVAVAPAVVVRSIGYGEQGQPVSLAGLVAVVRRFGRAYPRLCGALGGFDLARGAVLLLSVELAWAASVADRIDAVAAAGVGVAVAAFWYLSYAAAALLGAAAHRHADRLGLVAIGPGLDARGALGGAPVDVARRTRDALIEQVARDGDVAQAIDLVADALRERPSDLALHAQLHRLLLRQGDRLRIDAHAERCVALLLATDNAGEALPMVTALIRHAPDWRPREPAQVVPLARAALEAGLTDLAAHLIRGFDRRYPHHDDTPQVYVIAARTLLLSGRPAAEAVPWLDHVQAEYPHHPAAREAARVREQVRAGVVGAR